MTDHLFYIATKTWISAILARLGRIARFDPTIGQVAEQEPETWNPQQRAILPFQNKRNIWLTLQHSSVFVAIQHESSGFFYYCFFFFFFLAP